MPATDAWSWPRWLRIGTALAALATALGIAVQHDAIFPPGWPLAFALLAASPWVLELAGVELPNLVCSTIVLGAVLGLLLDPVNGEIAPFFLILLIIGLAASDSMLDLTLVTVASVVLIVALELSGRFPSSFGWVLGFGLAAAGGYAIWAQMCLVEKERALASEAAERAAAEERQRIAREIHDVIAHSLAVTMLHLTGARLALHRDPMEAEQALLEAERLGRESLAEIRRTVGLLAPESTGTTAPMPSACDIPQLVREFEAAGLDVDFELTGDPGSLPPSTGLGLFRVAQESLANVVRHAPGTHTTMSLCVGDDAVSLHVRNRLAGTSASTSTDGGLGVRGMQERVALLGGELRAGSDGDSWCVAVELPRVLESA